MKLLFSLALAVAALATAQAQAPQKAVALFDGRSFAGWEGDIKGTWRIQDGAIVGGSQTVQVPRNEFLTTTRSYGDFVLRVRFKLLGTEGLVNGCGTARRNKTLVAPDAKLIDEILKRGDWNDYEIRAEGARIRLSINGRQTIDYTETDPAIPRDGLIGLQIHGGGKAQIHYRDLMIQEIR